MKKFIDISILVVILSLCIKSIGQAETSESRWIQPQDSSKKIILYFRFDRSLLEKDYLTNKQSLEKLRLTLTDRDISSQIDSIVIQASASPEGSPVYNKQLAGQRANAVKSYLMWQYPYLNRNKITTYSIGENWTGLKLMIEEDSNVPFRKEVLELINTNLSLQEKDERLRQIGKGAAYAYINRHIFRYLRTGTTCVIFFHRPEPEDSIFMIEEEEITIDIPVAPYIPTESTEEIIAYSHHRPLAFKTNLLFDLATALNAEIEIPLSRKFSIAGELLFPWWLWTKKQNCFEIFTGTLEGRYWFKPNYKNQDSSLNTHNPLTGWFVGIYSNMGKYDFEWNKKGYQGEIYLSAGLSAGYVLSLNRNLNMEFSISAGYLQTDYRRYNAKQDSEQDWHLIKQYSGTLRWFGPTKAKISVVWYPHFKSSKKGGFKK